MLKDGLNKCGQNLIEFFNQINQIGKSRSHVIGFDHIVKLYNSSAILQRDQLNCQKIISTFDNLSKVSIIGGNLPIVYIHYLSLNYPGIEINVVEDSAAIHHVSDIISDTYNVNIINKNIVLDNLSYIIQQDQLTIYPETETLAPFHIQNYRNDNFKFCSNFLFYNYKHNINIATDTEQLAELCDIKQIITSGTNKIYCSDYNRHSIYVIGR